MALQARCAAVCVTRHGACVACHCRRSVSTTQFEGSGEVVDGCSAQRRSRSRAVARRRRLQPLQLLQGLQLREEAEELGCEYTIYSDI